MHQIAMDDMLTLAYWRVSMRVALLGSLHAHWVPPIRDKKTYKTQHRKHSIIKKTDLSLSPLSPERIDCLPFPKNAGTLRLIKQLKRDFTLPLQFYATTICHRCSKDSSIGGIKPVGFWTHADTQATSNSRRVFLH